MIATRPPLQMRAWTERQDAGSDPYGHGGAWADVLTDQPCSWWVASGAEKITSDRAVTIAGEFVRFASGADIQSNDRIRRLVDEDGEVIWDAATAAGLAREVEHVARRRGHLEAKLRSTS